MTEEDLSEDMLRTLARETALLPREIDPPADAWNRIRDVIDSARVVSIAPTTSWWQRPAVLAAAGLILVAGSSVVTATVMNDRAAAARAEDRGTRTPAAARQVTESLAQFTAMENDYIASANRLTEILESRQSDLSPETVAKLKESLRVIDAAIIEARRALAADPSNKALMEMLTASYTQKVDLLKRSTEMGES
jgi:hypothetical protein